MLILGLDPGKSTGYAMFDTLLGTRPIAFGTTKSRTELFDKLVDLDDILTQKYPRDTQMIVVVEDYINRPPRSGGYDHTWDKGFTHRVIGSIEYWAWVYQHEVVLQQPSIKPAGYGLVGLEYKKGKANMHHIDAMVHALFYIMQKGLLPKKDVLGCMGGAKT